LTDWALPQPTPYQVDLLIVVTSVLLLALDSAGGLEAFKVGARPWASSVCFCRTVLWSCRVASFADFCFLLHEPKIPLHTLTRRCVC
jgi:hypothetical protein